MARLIPTVMVFSKSSPPVSHTAEEDTPEADLRVAIEVYGKTVAATLAAAADGRPPAEGVSLRPVTAAAPRPLAGGACASSRSTPSATPPTCSRPPPGDPRSGTTCHTGRSPTPASCGLISPWRDFRRPALPRDLDPRRGGQAASSTTCASPPARLHRDRPHLVRRRRCSGPQPRRRRSTCSRAAFDDLGNRRLEWKCDAADARSRRAAERFGFTYEGVFRQHMIVKGHNRDTAWYSLLDSEWPAARAAFEAWLSPANFDPDGRQRSALRALPALFVSLLRPVTSRTTAEPVIAWTG